MLSWNRHYLLRVEGYITKQLVISGRVIIVFEVTLQVALWQKYFFFHHLSQNRTPGFSGICQNRTQISTSCFKIRTPPGKVKLLCPFSFQILNTKLKFFFLLSWLVMKKLNKKCWKHLFWKAIFMKIRNSIVEAFTIFYSIWELNCEHFPKQSDLFIYSIWNSRQVEI